MENIFTILRITFLAFILSFSMFAHPAFAFYGKDLETVNGILLKQELQNSKIENIEKSKAIYDETIKNSIEALKIKNEGIDFKSNYYDLALKLITLFGFLVVVIATILGFYKKGEIQNAREEVHGDLKTIKGEFDELKKEAKKKLDDEISLWKMQKKEMLDNLQIQYKDDYQSFLAKKLNSNETGSLCSDPLKDSVNSIESDEPKFD
jgi:hypothetical protein